MNCSKQTPRPEMHPIYNGRQTPICEFSGPTEYSCLFQGSEDLCPKNPENKIAETIALVEALKKDNKAVNSKC